MDKIEMGYNRTGKWVPCWSHGNFGKNYVSGGSWYAPETEKYGVCTLEEAIDILPEDVSAGKYFVKSESTRNRHWIRNYLNSFRK